VGTPPSISSRRAASRRSRATSRTSLRRVSRFVEILLARLEDFLEASGRVEGPRWIDVGPQSSGPAACEIRENFAEKFGEAFLVPSENAAELALGRVLENFVRAPRTR
jgi:hypothetical protein